MESGPIYPIGDEAALARHVAPLTDGWHLGFQSQLSQAGSVVREDRRGCNQEGVCTGRADRIEGRFIFFWSRRVEALDTDPGLLRYGLDGAICGGVPGAAVEQHRDALPLWESVMQEVQALPIQFGAEEDDTRDVAAWTGVALRPPCRDGVLASKGHDNRNGAGRRPSSPDSPWRYGNDDIRLGCHKFHRKSGKTLERIISREDLNADVAPFHKPELRQFREVQLAEGAYTKLIGGQ